MKNIIITALVALVVSIVTWQLLPTKGGEQSTKKESAYERVMRTGVIRCGYMNWPPISGKNIETNEMEGMMTDYMRALAKAAELKVEFTQEIVIDTYLQDLNNGRYDVECAGGWPNAIRGKLAAYVQPIAYYPLMAFVRVDDDRFDNDDITRINQPDVKVAIFDGGTDDLVQRRRFPNSDRLTLSAGVAGPDITLLNVASGKADVALTDSASGYRFMQANPNKLRPLSQPVRLIELNLSVAIGEQKLLNLLNEATDELKYDGVLDQIVDKYTSDTDKFVKPAKPYAE